MSTSTSEAGRSACPAPGPGRSLRGLRVLVMGLGRFGGGVGATRWLAGQGAHVTVTDLANHDALGESISALSDCQVAFRLGRHDPEDLHGCDLVVVNPAVDKSRSTYFRLVEERGIPWTTELNLFCERCPARVVGVTGTYGKSTTSTMLAEALRACVKRQKTSFGSVHLGGNIGRSLLTELDLIRRNDLVVLEMSSAQLEDLPRIGWGPSVAVITNLSPHHLDRYGGFGEYVGAKLQIIGPSGCTGIVVVGEIGTEAESILQTVLAERPGRLIRVTRPDPPVDLRIPGEHNQTNAACVLAVCAQLGLDEGATRDALRSFPGLPHRLQHIDTLDGVAYYNDSKATSPAATRTSLAALQGSVVAIVGGQRKDVPLAELAAALAQQCRAVICVGESGPLIAEALRSVVSSNQTCLVREAESLPHALQTARGVARPGDVVLFSPAAPSFDWYANYAERGEHFMDLVRSMSAGEFNLCGR